MLGPVKSVRFENAGSGVNRDRGILQELFEYDLRGNKKAWISYQTDGSLLTRETFEYDSASNLIAIKTYNSANLLQKTRMCHYDARGNKIEDAWFGAEAPTPIRKTVYIYNERGILIEERKINGSQTEKIVHRVDVNGGKLEDVYFDSKDKPVRKRVYTYDKGNLTQEILSTGDGTVAERREIAPEPDGGKRERIFAIHEGVLYKIRESAHDKNGNLTEKTFYSATGVLRKKWVYVYGENDRKIAERFFFKSGNVPQSRWAYSYDASGNLALESYYDKNATLRFKRRFASATGKKPAEWTRFDTQGTPLLKRTYRYDSAGNLTGWEDFDSHNAPVGTRSISAGERWIEPGQTRERPTTFADDEFAYILTFDAHGNWIKKAVLQQTGSAGALVYELRQTISRSIEYHKN